MSKVIVVFIAVLASLMLAGCDMAETGEAAEDVSNKKNVPTFTVETQDGKKVNCFWLDKGVTDGRTGGPVCWESK